MLIPDRFQPGSDLVAPLNGLRDFFARLAKLDVAPPLELHRDSGGRTIRRSAPAGGWAILSGTTSPYTFAWAHHVSGTTWAAEPASTAGQLAYEVNAAAGLGGTRAFLRPGGVAKQWVFTEVRSGTAACSGTICVTVTTPGVYTPTTVVGATVTVYDGPTTASAVLGTCTTDSAGRCCVDITAAKTYAWKVHKTGYNDATGTVAAGCFENDVAVSLTVASNVDCGACGNAVPATLTLSDGHGSVTLTNTALNTWEGCATRTAATGYPDPCPGSQFPISTNVAVPVHFILACSSSGGGTFTLRYRIPVCFPTGTNRPTAKSCASYPWSTQFDSGAGVPTGPPTCSPFHVTFSTGTPPVNDPTYQVWGASGTTFSITE